MQSASARAGGDSERRIRREILWPARYDKWQREFDAGMARLEAHAKHFKRPRMIWLQIVKFAGMAASAAVLVAYTLRASGLGS